MSPTQEEARVNALIREIELRKLNEQLRQWMKEVKPGMMVTLVDADELFGGRA